MESLSFQKDSEIYHDPHLMFPNLSRSHSLTGNTSAGLSFPSHSKVFMPTTFSRFRHASNSSTEKSNTPTPEKISNSQNIPANGKLTKKKSAQKSLFGFQNKKRKPLQRIDNIPFDDISSPLLTKGTGVHKALLELQRIGSIEKGTGSNGPSFEDWHTPEKDVNEIVEKHQNEKTSKLLDSNTDIVESEYSRLMTDYQILEILGKGSFGKVYRCINKIDKNEYAIKETFRNFTGKNKIYSLNETYALASLTAIEDNINVVRYFNAWIEDEKLFLAMEYCPSSLYKERKTKGKFTEAEVKHIMRDICLGLSYLHRHNMVHLDIKPENILISKTKKYKLGDMGQSRNAILQADDIEEGDSRYLALELLNYEDEEDQIDLKKADIFSLGMTMFELITNHQIPPNGDEWHALRNGELQLLDKTPGFSHRIKNLVRKMLSKNPLERPSVPELLAKELPSEMELELKWERMENKMLQSKKLKLEEKLEQRNKRRRSVS